MIQTIYTYGGGETLVYLFNGIAAIFGSGINSNLLLFTGVLGAVWTTVVMYAQNSLDSGIKWFLWFLIASNLLILPKTSVIIEDPITDPIRQYALGNKIDNVPLVLALFVGSVSSIGKALTEQIEAVFTLPDYQPYHQTGMVFASRLFSEMQNFHVTDPVFQANLNKFVNNCVVYDAMIGYKYTLNDLFTTNDIWGLVSESPSQVLGFYYKDSGRNRRGSFKTCAASALELTATWNRQIELASNRYGKTFFGSNNDKIAAEAMMSQLPNSYQLLTGMAENAVNILQQQLLINTISNSTNNKISEFNNSINYATAKSLLQQRNNSIIVGEMAAKTLPIMKSVFEALCYGAFIFIAFLVLLPNGHKMLAQYLGVVVWLQLWAPLYAIVNLIITLYARNKSMGFVGEDGLTIFTSIGFSNINADMSAMAGWLSMLIPFLSYGLLKGGVGSFMHLANSITGATQSAAASTASEITSGNFSMGNITQGVTAANNVTAFKHNTNVEYMSGQHKSNMNDGMTKTVNPDGSVVYQGGAGFTKSAFANTVTESNSLSSVLSDAAAKESTLAMNDSTSLTKQHNIAENQLANLMKTYNKGQHDGKNYDVTNSAGTGKSFNKTMKLAESFRNNFGISQNDSMELAASVAINSKNSIIGKLAKLTFGASGGVSSKYTSHAGESISYDHVKDFMRDQNFTETTDNVLRSAAGMNFGERNSEENALSQGLGVSVSNIDTLTSSKTAHERSAANLTHNASLAHGEGFDVRGDITEAGLQFLANMPTMNGNDKVGIETARKMMDANDGPLAQRRRDGLQLFQQNRDNAIQNIVKDRHFNNAAELQDAIKNIKTTDLTKVGQNKLASVQNQGASQGLQSGHVNSGSRDTVNTNINNAKSKLDGAKSNIQQQGTEMKDMVAGEMDRNIGWVATKNVLSSAWDVGTSLTSKAINMSFNTNLKPKPWNEFNSKVDKLSTDDDE